MRRIDLIAFRWPYLLPHCGFPFSASQLGKSYVRKKVMCGPHASLRSSVASHPTLPTPSDTDTYIDSTSTTLARDVSEMYVSVLVRAQK